MVFYDFILIFVNDFLETDKSTLEIIIYFSSICTLNIYHTLHSERICDMLADICITVAKKLRETKLKACDCRQLHLRVFVSTTTGYCCFAVHVYIL